MTFLALLKLSREFPRGVLNRQGPNRLASPGECPYTPPCPYSHVPVVACWSVDLRTRGRKNASRRGSGALLQPPMNGPAAGGEPAAPPEAGDAAQSNDGAGFFGLCRVPSPATEEACPSCRACGRGSPFQTMAPRSLWLRVMRVRGFPTTNGAASPLSSLLSGGAGSTDAPRRRVRVSTLRHDEPMHPV